jgi:hypothetical protein
MPVGKQELASSRIIYYSIFNQISTMILKNKTVSASGIVIVFLVLINVIAIRNGFVNDPSWYWAVAFTFPILIIVMRKARQRTQPSHRKFRRRIIHKTRRQQSEISI